MDVNTLIIQHADGTITREQFTPPSSHSVKVQPGDTYRIVQLINGQEVLLDDLIAQKSGDNLELIYTNGVEIQLEGFYSVEDSSVFLPGEKEDYTLTSDAGSISSEGSVSTVYAHGNSTSLMELVKGNDALESAISSELRGEEQGIITLASDMGATAFSSGAWLAGLLGAGAVAALAGGGGGGGDATPSVNDDPLVIDGEITGGPIVSSHGLTVEAFDNQGLSLGSTTVNADGTFSITAQRSNYSGSFLVKVTDGVDAAGNDTADYIDERTGLPADLTVDLRAVAVSSGTGSVTVNITPITEIAAAKLVSGDNIADAATVKSINAATGQIFGVSDILANVSPVINTAGEAETNSNTYGEALALLSGLDGVAGGSMQATIDLFVDGLVLTEAGSLARSDSQAGTDLNTALADLTISNIGSTSQTQQDSISTMINRVTTLELAPTISSGAASSVDENMTAGTVVYTATSSSTLAEPVYSFTGDLSVFSFDSATAQVTLLASPDFETLSHYTFSISLTDSAATETPVTTVKHVIVTVNDLNEATTLTSDTSASVDENSEAATIVYQATASDLDLSSVTSIIYSLAGTDAANFDINESTGAVSFKSTVQPDFETKTSYEIDVTATDRGDSATSATQTVTLTVNNVNEAPTVSTPISDTTAVVNQAFNLDITSHFTDVDAADSLSYTATGLPTGFTIDSATGIITGTAAESEDGNTFTVTVTASDAAGLTVSDEFGINAVSAPVITNIASADGAEIVKSGLPQTFAVTLTEPVTVAGGNPTLTLDINGTSTTATYQTGSTTQTLLFLTDVIAEGDGNAVTITAITLADGVTIVGDISGQGLMTTVVGQTTNDLTIDDTGPAVTSSSFDVAENSTAVGTVAVTEANGIQASGAYTLAGTDAALFTISDAGVLALKSAENFEVPNDVGTNGVYDITVAATDTAGNTGAAQAITVNLKNVNEAPIVDDSVNADSVQVVNQPVTLDASVSIRDPDAGDTLSYAITGGTLPTGLTLDPNTGIISGTATAPTAGLLNIHITATDEGGLSVSDDFDLTVVSAPTISSIALSGGEALAQSGASHTFAVTFTESVSVAGGNPTLTLNINGTLTTATYTGGTGSNKLLFAVTSLPVGDGNAVELLAITLPTGVTITGDDTSQAALLSTVVGQSTTGLTIDDTNPIVTSTSFDVDENTTAVGTVAVTEANGIKASGGYTLAGTDAALFTISDTGVLALKIAGDVEYPTDDGYNRIYDITVAATDMAGNTGDAQAITVNLKDVNENPFVTSPISNVDAVIDQAFNLNVTQHFSDVDTSDTLSYTATGLPTGFAIDSATGIISGTAATSMDATIFAVTVLATDSAGLTVSDDFDLTVVSAPTISSIALSGGEALAQSGASHTFAVTFTESVSVADGNPTLTLNINGTPTTATYTGGTGTNTLMFAVASLPVGDGNAVELTAITLPEGVTITSDVTNQALLTTVVGQTTTGLTIDDTKPIVTSTSFDVDENTTAVGTVTVTEANGIKASEGYTLAGTDADLFAISDAGALALKLADDFEYPGVNGPDREYSITVAATDMAGNTGDAQAITVNLKDVNEAPRVVSGAPNTETVIVNSAFSSSASGLFTDLDADTTLSYSATGLKGDFEINPTTGEITGTATEVIEPHTIIITASDGDLSVTHSVLITVISAPTMTSTVHEVTNLDVRSPIVLTFSEPVSKGSGNIVITDLNDGGIGWKNDDQNNTQTIAFTSDLVMISGNTVTINPDFDFDFATNYEITFAAGTFTGNTSAQNSIAVESGDFTFTTVTPTNSGAASQIQEAGTDALVSSHKFVSAHQSDPNSELVEVDASSEAIALVLSFENTGINGTRQTADGYISFKGVTKDDVLYLDRTALDLSGDLAINGGGSWNSEIDSDGATSYQKAFASDGLGARVIYNGQTNIFADYFLDDSLGAERDSSIVIG